MTFWCGSGSGDPCLWLMDSDPDPAIFVTNLQDANKKLTEKKVSDYYFLKVPFIYIIFQSKKTKRSHKTVGIDVFIFIFCLMIEGWYKDPDQYLWLMDPDPGGPQTCGSGHETLHATEWRQLGSLKVRTIVLRIGIVLLAIQRVECLNGILVEVSGHINSNSQTRDFVWFSTLIFPFYKMLLMNRLEFSCFADKKNFNILDRSDRIRIQNAGCIK